MTQPTQADEPTPEKPAEPVQPAPDTQPAAEPAPAASTDPAPAQQEPDVQQRLTESQTTVERLKGQVSASDRRVNDLSAQHQQELDTMRQQVHDLRTVDMDDNQRAVYERDQLQVQLTASRQEIADVRSKADYDTGMSKWSTYFQGMGVPANELNANSFESLQGSAWAWVQKNMPQQQQEPTVNLAGQRPPKVASHTPGAAAASPQMFKDLPYKDWEKTFKDAESGRTKPADLPR